MATAYTTRGRNKVIGAVLADVSDSTSPVTSRQDAQETVEAMADTQNNACQFTETTAAAERSSPVYPVHFNATIKSVYFDMEAGGVPTAHGYTNYASVIMRKWDASGLNTTTVASWTAVTDTVGTFLGKAIPLVAADAYLVKGGTYQFQITKTGSGATTGVTNVSALLRRKDD